MISNLEILADILISAREEKNGHKEDFQKKVELAILKYQNSKKLNDRSQTLKC